MVTCNGNPTSVSVPGGGGIGSPVITGVDGQTCIVEEDTTAFPPGTVVTYDPPEANTTGVAVSQGQAITVTVTNDFSDIEPPTGQLEVVKELIPPGAGVVIPPNFVIDVLCDDGTQAVVTVPGSGGVGTPIVTADAGAGCSLEEVGLDALPPGWVVTYSVNGGPSTAELPFVTIVEGETVTISIINDPTQVLAEGVTRADDGAVTGQPSFTG